jgi:hypothetical protein
MLARGFRTRALRARGRPHLFFHREVEVTIARTGRAYACQVQDPAVSARGASPEAALAAALEKLRSEVEDLRTRPTHTLPREKISRKGVLLSVIDIVTSGLIEGASDEAWVVGWLERRGDELCFVSDESEVYALDEELFALPADDRLRFARVRAGPGGEPIGPVKALEEPFLGDPDEMLREFQKRVGANG